MNLLHEYIKEQLLLERQSIISSVTDYVGTHGYDDMMDDVFKQLAPNLVRHVLTREVNEDMAEFLDGAHEGRFERRADWVAPDPSPQQVGYGTDSTDYILGYTWGWNNARTWTGKQLPTQARKEAVERQIEEFEDQISEQMVIAALEAANEKINPIKLLGKAKDAIWDAVEEEGLAGGLKKGLPIAIGILVGEALDNFIIPMAFYSMTGIPIPPLPVGVGEIINPVVISMVGADVESDELADELGWYEGEYGEAEELGPRRVEEIRYYIRGLLKESAEEIASVLELWDTPGGNGEVQAKELAYMMGTEFSRHPDLQIWSIYNAEEGDLVIEGLNFDQAMDPKYQAFAAWTSGYIHTEYEDRKNNPWGTTINGANARHYPPADLDFEEAADTMREEGWKTEVVDVDEEIFAVMVKLVDV